MQINLMFPTPVYNVIDTEDRCDRTALREACLAATDDPAINARDNVFHRVDTSYMKNDRLHQREPFALLTAYVEEHGREFAQALGFPGWSLDIRRMWTNVGKRGDFVYPHSHVGEGFVAGVYYVSCDERDGISILDAVERLSPEVSNNLNCSSYYYEGMEGRLLLFRAETLHTTFPQQGDERIIISFNMQLKQP